MITVLDQARPWLRPSNTLATIDPAPVGRPDEQERHRQADEPAGDEDRLAAEPIGEGAGREVGERPS